MDIYRESYAAPPKAVTLDIDDTAGIVHGHRQLSLFNAREDGRCFKPAHVYDTATGRPVMVLLRAEPLDWIGGVQFCPVRCREGHVGEDIMLGFVHQGGELRQFGAQPIGDLAPLALAEFPGDMKGDAHRGSGARSSRS